MDPCTAKQASDGASSLQHSQLHTHFLLVDGAGCSTNASSAVRSFRGLKTGSFEAIGAQFQWMASEPALLIFWVVGVEVPVR